MKVSVINSDLSRLDFFKEIKIEGYELTIGETATDFLDNFEEMKTKIIENNLTITSIGQWGATKHSNGLLNEKQILIDKKLIECCVEVNTKVFVTGFNYDENITLLANYNNAVSYFKIITEYAKELGIKVAVYNCDWNNFIYDEEAWKIVLGEVEDLYIKYDPSHAYYRNSDYIGEIENWANKFAHFHLKGAMKKDGRRIDDPPIGIDQLDWNTIITLLHIKGYEGYLSLEPHGSSPRLNNEYSKSGIVKSKQYIDNLLSFYRCEEK